MDDYLQTALRSCADNIDEAMILIESHEAEDVIFVVLENVSNSLRTLAEGDGQ